MTLTKTERAKLESARAKIEATKMSLLKHMEEHADTIDTYLSLRHDYDSAVESAKTLYRDHINELGDSWSGFAARHTPILDAGALLKLMGKDAEPLVEAKYVVRRELYYAAVDDGKIPKKVIEAVERGTQVSITAPKL